jgi:hypothetical protein
MNMMSSSDRTTGTYNYVAERELLRRWLDRDRRDEALDAELAAREVPLTVRRALFGLDGRVADADIVLALRSAGYDAAAIARLFADCPVGAARPHLDLAELVRAADVRLGAGRDGDALLLSLCTDLAGEAGGWEGRPTALYEELTRRARAGGALPLRWPRRPETLTGRLRDLELRLLAAGVEWRHFRVVGRIDRRRPIVHVLRPAARAARGGPEGRGRTIRGLLARLRSLRGRGGLPSAPPAGGRDTGPTPDEASRDG